ncbi:MAG: rod shape-determining protein RodA [Lentisphaerae bacterium]|jgi:rod shape determining protein RodA|nr:rod shape-determining protein RodA [Lentisphaerota bacterium]
MKKRVQAWWRVWLAQDFLALLTVAGLLATGLAFVYSASWRGEEIGLAGAWFSRQVWWVLYGIVAALVMTAVDYRFWLRHAWWLYLASVVLLALVLPLGTRVFGAARWLNVFGVLLQVSEFAKLALVLVLARVLGGGAIQPNSLAMVVVAGLIAVVPFVLIAAEPDLGTAAVLVPTIVVMLLAAGAPFRWLAAIALLGAGGAAAILSPLGSLILSEYQRERILTFLDPSRDPLGAGWNAIQSAIAVGSGGVGGKGFLNGTQNVLGFLPRTVAPTDFIFPVLAEEKGFVGASLLLLGFAVLLTCYIRTAWTARHPAGSLLVTGIAGLVFAHVFINIGMTIGLLPITGLPLPFVSSGGSFMLSTLAGFGLVQSVHVRRARREVNNV